MAKQNLYCYKNGKIDKCQRSEFFYLVPLNLNSLTDYIEAGLPNERNYKWQKGQSLVELLESVVPGIYLNNWIYITVVTEGKQLHRITDKDKIKLLIDLVKNTKLNFKDMIIHMFL